MFEQPLQQIHKSELLQIQVEMLNYMLLLRLNPTEPMHYIVMISEPFVILVNA